MRTRAWLFLTLGVVFSSVNAFAQYLSPCVSVSGSWLDDAGLRWNLTQSDTSISGTNTGNDGCPFPTWNVYGTYNGSGNFRVVAYNPSGGDFFCAAWLLYDGHTNQPGCHTGQGGWLSQAGYFGDFFWAKSCDIPTGESTIFNNWYGPYAGFRQTLAPGSINFEGRRVTEYDAGGGGPDTCWFAGSTYDPFIAIGSPFGNSWDVAWLDGMFYVGNNQYGNDYVGYGDNRITYYRGQGRAPCETTFPQRLTIDCALGSPTYRSSVPLGAAIGIFTVSGSRDGQTQTTTYP